jgi:hypothetical protein
MSEEESTHGIVRIGVGFGILMMNTMVTRPMEDRSLVGDRITEHEEETHGEGGFVKSMRPKTIRTDYYADATYWPQNKSPNQSLLRNIETLDNPSDTNHMNQRNVNAHGPVDRTRLPVVTYQRWDFANHFPREIHDCLVVCIPRK